VKLDRARLAARSERHGASHSEPVERAEPKGR
jgi:hypothetical protein